MTKFECHKLQEGYFNVQGYLSIQGRFYVDSNSEKLDPMISFGRPSLSVWTLITQQLMSGQGGNTIWTPISVYKL